MTAGMWKSVSSSILGCITEGQVNGEQLGSVGVQRDLYMHMHQ